MKKAVIVFVLLAVATAAGWFALQKWRQDASAEIGSLEEQLREVTEDKAKMAAALAAARRKNASFRNGNEAYILVAASDKTVNELARQYLGCDLLPQKLAAEKQLAELNRKQADTKKLQHKYQAETKKVQKQIVDLERKRQHLERMKMMTAVSKREQLFDEMSRTDDKIAELRKTEAELKKGDDGAGDVEAMRLKQQEVYRQLEQDTAKRLEAVIAGVEVRLQSRLDACRKGVPEWLMKLGLGK